MLTLCHYLSCFISIDWFSPHRNSVKKYFYLHFTEGKTKHGEIKYLAQGDIVNELAEI